MSFWAIRTFDIWVTEINSLYKRLNLVTLGCFNIKIMVHLYNWGNPFSGRPFLFPYELVMFL